MQSQYLQELLTNYPDVGRRYLDKIALIGVDPYLLKGSELDYSLASVPPVTYSDTAAYLVFGHSFYSNEQMKAFKSVEAYKYFQSGFVLKAGTKIISNLHVLVDKVKHSQRANKKPLTVWSIIHEDGSVANAHCTCMAGTGEVCSHIAALLFVADYGHKKTAISCTDVLAGWVKPSHATSVPVLEVSDLDFGRSTGKTTKYPKSPLTNVKKILTKVQNKGHSAAVMRVVEPFASKIYTENNTILKTLFDIYDEINLGKYHSELLKLGKEISLTISQEECFRIEKYTRSQQNNHNWYKQRAGRIAASKLRSVLKTSRNSPSLSFIKSSCYPTKMFFVPKAIECGLKHEDVAAEEYRKQMEDMHGNFVINAVGLIINPKYPQLGASLDRMVYCECCLGGVVEIKCPYLQHANNIGDINEYINMRNSCLESNGDSPRLERYHQYYYLVQMQIFINNVQYCDFVVWSPKIFHNERILPDFQFWEENCDEILKFHAEIIMPELLVRYFTKREGAAEIQYWCDCRKVDDGTPMIQCDSDNCKIKWFHISCVGLIDTPNTPWFCDNCKYIYKDQHCIFIFYISVFVYKISAGLHYR